ncbi:MAG: tRNA (adenosine(37)-N6)-dimethylallyltransferase MiaA [Clostridia bacterium]|nr:tRNA (adenosine(37)-N6)-dimethylallyltransferase MiaA [Clostridia bacterium]
MAGDENKIKTVAVMGTTASGKSGLSVELSLIFNGEVISCDSAQVYRGPEIATAKITKEEMKGVPHHLIDFADPLSVYSCADFRNDAGRVAEEIAGRDRLPVLCGGTGLYLDALFRAGEMSPGIPEGIRERLSLMSPDELWEKLAEVDPISAEGIHRNNVRRVIRALEIFEGTGVTKTEWDARSRKGNDRYSPLIIILTYRDRGALYEAVDRRVDGMVKAGLFEELEEWDLPRDCPMAGVIGCREGYLVIDGKIPKSEGIELIKKNTRNYAKRQLTWFSENRYPDALRIYAEDGKTGREKAVEAVRRHLGA